MTSSGGGYYNINAGDDGGYGITSNASATTSLISGGINVRGGNLNFNVAQGTTTSGVDLLVSGPIINNAITKTGAGTLALTGANTYAGGTTVSAGHLTFVNNHSGSSNFADKGPWSSMSRREPRFVRRNHQRRGNLCQIRYRHIAVWRKAARVRQLA